MVRILQVMQLKQNLINRLLAAPNGGYLAAIIHRVVTSHMQRAVTWRHSGRATVINMQLTYVRRCNIGPAKVDIQEVKVGSRVSVIHVTLSQSSARLVGHVTVSDPVSEMGVSIPTRLEVSRGLSPETSNPWEKFTITHPEFRRASSQVELYKSAESSLGSVSQRARFRPCQKASRWTNEAVAFLSYIFPISLAEVERSLWCGSAKESGLGPGSPVWFPTLVMNIDFKQNLPTAGVEWLYSHVEIKSIHNGRMDVTVTIEDAQGKLVAIANQAALVLSAARNARNLPKAAL